MIENLKTKTIRTGAKVLAKTSRCGELTAVQFVNRTQAIKRATALIGLGQSAEVIQPFCGRCFYVHILD